ncbi:zinc c2h2 type domain-containing protein [Cordyceps javanica]|uniref:Zinc c2h2 type domain-containing protein n=1 Tax=Cordyceps javanica TaxID=43265 RepID=A0A545UM85_9HYPO|nr:zinc c2h2 type domain-containing protein [Cordyceps javanica]TQW02007.1 zinc c2h2 type domain containing protein [Cordyceps javanica]
MSVDGGGYKRASRKGAPRKFICEHPGCDKIYSRAEHLQRHQLNHNPKEIFRCDLGDCDQKFVRLDLLTRHKKRHTASYTPRNRIPSFDTSVNHGASLDPSAQEVNTNAPGVASSRPPYGHHAHPHLGGPHDAAILLTPESNTEPTPTALGHSLQGRPGHPGSIWPTAMDEQSQPSLMRSRNSFYASDPTSIAEPSNLIPFPSAPYPSDSQMNQGNFAAWLFDTQTTYGDFSVSNLPFLDGGLESTFNNTIQYDYESLNSLSPIAPTPPRHSDAPDEWITEAKRKELLQWFQIFRKKQSKYDHLMTTLTHESGGDLPALNVEMLRECLKEFWDSVSPRLPIVHQHTFSATRCSVFLLLVMVALGAASLKARDRTGQQSEYGAFADVIVHSVRWEILTSDDSAPPANLWVAQALLLVEFYEKLYSSRRFHERAHIYHSSFLTLLRRGSPLIGRTGSESPAEPEALHERAASGIPLDSHTWWTRWAETESMHRVVFAAFMLDIIHAAIFGHAADMAAHEIRLPLPCDDNLWVANSPDEVRQLDANFRMYGFKQVSFLDGLKSALHGKEVKTHSFGRMIIISGLLSIGWHLSHRETHLKWLDLRTPSTEVQDNWRKMLLLAFDNWKGSFDVAMSGSMSESPAGSQHHGGHRRGISNGPIHSAHLLFHLAHMTPNVDIIDCQVYAGAKRILGRKVSARDCANAVKRMVAWAKLGSTRHAIYHAFRLLHRVLVEPHHQRRRGAPTARSSGGGGGCCYSIRDEPDPHRPWIMYFAVLTIWTFVQALGRSTGKPLPLQSPDMASTTQGRMAEYLSRVSALPELDEQSAGSLQDGLPDLLDVMVGVLEEADTELLVEARNRLRVCKEMILGGSR